MQQPEQPDLTTPTPAGPGLLGGLVPTPPVETDSEGGEA
jgi:hypothetical protein